MIIYTGFDKTPFSCLFYKLSLQLLPQNSVDMGNGAITSSRIATFDLSQWLSQDFQKWFAILKT